MSLGTCLLGKVSKHTFESAQAWYIAIYVFLEAENAQAEARRVRTPIGYSTSRPWTRRTRPRVRVSALRGAASRRVDRSASNSICSSPRPPVAFTLSQPPHNSSRCCTEVHLVTIRMFLHNLSGLCLFQAHQVTPASSNRLPNCKRTFVGSLSGCCGHRSAHTADS